ncbi:MAG TPA: sugar MFS transporter [Puia sp.]|uniref:sugar MFS transporter n=1 Tax=Puia sp. TaxID=2045100 RepID=UPI002B6F780F|nr:sugar MFS transporter [Puia sp.]HVU94341.1 sugar MFS transporter [Puia sp.]
MMRTNNYRPAFIVITILFFMWGFITCMNDILVPFLRKLFALTYFQAMLVQFSFFGAYFIGSLIYYIVSVGKGDPIARIGYKKSIIAGLLLSAVGCLLFYPAASGRLYGLFLFALFVLGLGFTVLQVSANPFVAILGEPGTASSRLNLSQAFNSLGTTLAPVAGGYFVFHNFAAKGMPAESIKIPYLLFAGIFVILSIIVRVSPLPEFEHAAPAGRKAGALNYRHLRLGMLAIFTYVGAEVGIGSFLISYLHESVGFSELAAKSYLAFYWGGLMIGRFMGSAVFDSAAASSRKWAYILGAALLTFGMIFSMVWIESGFTFRFSTATPFLAIIFLNAGAFYIGKASPDRTLAVFALLSIGLLAAALLTGGLVSVWALIGIGLFNSIMWSNIFTLAISGLGKDTGQGSSLLIMAILGAAFIPLLQGGIADRIGLHHSFIVPVFCYAYLVYYGWRGYRPGAGFCSSSASIEPHEKKY